MLKAPTPPNEKERLCAVAGLNVLDTPPDPRFESITNEATKRFFVPISTLTVIDGEREWFKSVQGTEEKEGSRDISFCGHALLEKDIFIVEDTLKDERFADNPMVTGKPYIRFYAGKSLFAFNENLPVAVFCIKDYVPHTMSPRDIQDFLALASRAEIQLNRYKTKK